MSIALGRAIFCGKGTRNNRSEWRRGKVLAFKTIGRGFAPRTCFVFFRPRRGVRLLIAAYDLSLHI